MALRLRRGTNAERLTVTPESGEIIYVTDSKKLYVGDGSTVGGNLVSGVNNIIDDATPQLGGDLDLNSNNIIGNGNININGTITATGNINLGDGAGGDVISVGGEVSGSLVPTNDESFTLGSPSNRWQAVWASSAVISGQVDAVAVNANIIADDSTVAFDASTGTFVGNMLGTLDGDVTGSVFSDDSTLLINAQTNESFFTTLHVNNITPATDDSIAVDAVLDSLVFELNSQAATTNLTLRKQDLSTDLAGDDGAYGIINFERRDNQGLTTISQIYGGGDGYLYFSANENGLPAPESSTLTWYQDRLGIGTFTPTETLDVKGNGVFTGTVDAASFKGSLVADDSTILIDAINGSLLVANIDIVGTTGNTPATPGSVDSWLEVTVNGATKYVPLYV